MTFEVVGGNIINISADAIVLPANESLKEGSGTSTAIFQAAGREKLTAACQKIGHCNVGNAVPTPAFHLNAEYIIHAVVPKWIDGKHDEYDLLSSAYFSAMYIADIMGCRQIAFPLLASGNNGFDRSLALEIAVKSIKTFENNNLKNAYLVLYGDKITELAEQYGYHVLHIPEGMPEQKKDQHHNNMLEIAAGYKEEGQKFIENQLNKGLEWFKNPDNQEKVVELGKKIVVEIIKHAV